jgi:class 3 adenylate cyclase
MSEERRLVTILFADVRGSTAAAEALDPDDLRALLSRYYAIAREVVADYGGTLEKFIGDAVMAVFGLPVAHGDDAERAIGAPIRCAGSSRRTTWPGRAATTLARCGGRSASGRSWTGFACRRGSTCSERC